MRRTLSSRIMTLQQQLILLFVVCATLLCTTTTDARLKFTCRDGTQIRMEDFCNGRENCDGSDELLTSTSCPGCNNKEISCTISATNRSCIIHRDYICNNSVTCQGIDHCDVRCPGHYRCQNNRCVERSTLCDENPQNGCPEDDGWKTGIGFRCVRSGRVCRIPQQLLHDDVQDCDQGEDRCFNFNNNSVTFDQSRCFLCLDRSMIIPRARVCDDIIDCSDLSDECLCENLPNICAQVKMRTETKNTRISDSCEIGQVSCGNEVCINRTSVCDSVADCSDNRDEKFKYCEGTLRCKDGIPSDAGEDCRCSNEHRNIVGTLCDGIAQCPPPGPPYVKWGDPPGYPDDECEPRCVHNELGCTINISMALGTPTRTITCQSFIDGFARPTEEIAVERENICDGIIDCTADGKDESNCPNRYKCAAGRHVNIAETQLCDGIIDCDDKSDENNHNCSHRFYCPSLAGTKVSIEEDLNCDFNINCDDYSDEMNCTDTRFYCENKSPLFVRRQQVFDGYKDCSDFSDECPTTERPSEDIFSSRYNLIQNPFLRTLVWIMGLMALGGNLAVIRGEIINLNKLRKEGSTASLRTNRMLVLNLAIADLLMGIYLLSLGIAGGVYAGSFCIYKLSWLTGTTCQALGSLVVLSSETSVITLLLLTSCRLYAVLKPFDARIRPKPSRILIAILIAWSISFVVAFVPFTHNLQYIFTDAALIHNNPFFNNAVVNLDAAKTWLERMVTFNPEFSGVTDEVFTTIKDATSWSDLQAVLQNTSYKNSLDISAYFGYYSANSVCIPRLFVTNKDKSWQFSIAITMFNFLSFMFVAICYAFIIVKSQQSAKNIRTNTTNSNAKKTKTMHRRILRLIVTDFCCWVPISIMAFVSFSEVYVSDVAYAVSAIVLLPINSALNPILYSEFLDQMWDRIVEKLKPPESEQTTIEMSDPRT